MLIVGGRTHEIIILQPIVFPIKLGLRFQMLLGKKNHAEKGNIPLLKYNTYWDK